MATSPSADAPTGSVPPAPRRTRLRYLVPRLDATLVLRAEVATAAAREGRLESPLTFQTGAPAEVRPLLEALPPEERKSALRRIASADLVVYSLVDGELAFWEFVQLGRAEIPPDLPRAGGTTRSAYIFGAFTRPAHRGHGVFTCALRWLLDWLEAQGYTDLYSQTAVEDVVPLLAHFAAGFEALGESRHLHWGGRRYLRPTRLLARPLGPGCGPAPDLSGVSARAQATLRRALPCPR